MNHFSCESVGASKTSKSGRHYLVPLAAVGSVLMSSGALSQEAASIKLGETELVPVVRVDYVSIDNLYRKGIDEVSGSGVLVKPELSWLADRRLLKLSARYFGEYGTFSEDGLDYDNHDVRLNGAADLSNKQRLTAGIRFYKTVEQQGTGQTTSVTDVLDDQIERIGVTANAKYVYGASDARGNLSLGLVLGEVSYSNLEQFTDGDDYSFIQPYGVFSLRVSPDTRVLAEVRFGALDFDDDLRDRNEVSLLAGVDLNSSSKLSGDARIGVVKASFEQDSDDDTTALIAEIGLYYSPVSYSQFSVNFDRALKTEDQTTDNVTGQSINDAAVFAWIHDWSSRFQTLATLSLDSDDRDCPNIDDQTAGVGLELNFQVRRWLQFGISGSQFSRTISTCDNTTVNEEALEYDRSVVGVHVRATL